MFQDSQLKPGDVIGIIGGGQLARMMCFEAAKLGFKTCIYSDTENSPAFQVATSYVCASYDDTKALEGFTDRVSSVTFEFENLPVETLNFIASKLPLRPGAKALEISQNRLVEKKFFNDNNIATAEYLEITSYEDLVAGFNKFQDSILKTATLGYDGKGQFSISSGSTLEKIWHDATESNLPLILEKTVPFEREFSIVAARSIDSKIIYYDVVENIHESGILKKTIFPAKIDPNIKDQAEEIARITLESLEYVGVLAIEFFLVDGKLLVNEFAPRPHNSGHFSLDACLHSQFEQGIRAAAGISVIEPELLFSGRMVNLLGEEVNQIPELNKNSSVKTHHYGKSEIKPGRKMGHYVVRD